jgi:Ni/Co efflux regulator RcnB
MKSKALVSVLIGVTCLTAPVLSFADHDDGWRGDDRHWEHHEGRHWDRDDRRDHDWDRRHEWREDREWRGERHEWRRGGYVPREYWGPRYYVRDWRAYHLYEPPYGYRWVSVNGDFVLAAIATGIIANVILGGR